MRIRSASLARNTTRLLAVVLIARFTHRIHRPAVLGAHRGRRIWNWIHLFQLGKPL